MHLRVATPADNAQLVALARITPMHGAISICIQREPDFFSILQTKGEPHTIVADENNKVVGCVSIVREQRMVFNEPVTIHYICDLKVHPGYRNKKIGTLLSKEMHQYLLNKNADLIFSTVAKDNIKVLPLFNGKSGLKNVQPVGEFIIYQVLAGKLKNRHHSFTIEQCNDDNLLIGLYKKFAQRYSFYSLQAQQNKAAGKTFVASTNNKIVAALTLADHSHLKQNVVMDMPWHYKLLLAALKLLKPFLPITTLPQKRAALQTLYVSRFMCEAGYEEALRALIDYAREYAFQRNYTFISIAFNKKDELRKILNGFIVFAYKANGMMCSLTNNNELVDRIKQGNAYEDFTLI